MTEVPIGAAIGRPDFARRNRIIAGLAEAVVVVEAPDRSGALLTAAAAIAIGRELYAVPGPIDAMASRGTNRLIADHQATIVTSSPALLAADRHQARVSARPPSRPSRRWRGSCSGISWSAADRSRSWSIGRRQPAASVASALALLEARGLVNPFGGATFHPTLAARRLGGAV